MTLKKLILPILLVAACVAASTISIVVYAGNHAATAPSGKTATRTISVGTFDELDTYLVDVEVTVAPATGVAKLEADEAIKDMITVTTRRGTLKIDVTDRDAFRRNKDKYKATLYITAPYLEEIDAAVGARVTFDSPFTAPANIELDASTGASIHLPGLTTGGKTELSTSTAGAITIDTIATSRLECDASTAGTITVKNGKTNTADYEASTAATIDCGGVTASTGKVESSTGATVCSHITGAIKIERSTGGTASNI